jgi:tRNA(Ile)-lysidine synthase TilS/MesJ|tara:strand:+ start:1103 stop:1768 length:666 start_codon:yes stop_codon:yes gene_type:complete
MLFKNSQDDYKMSIDSSITRIGLKISGGADSALVAYMLAKYSEAERPDLKIYPITGVSEQKPFQAIFSKKVITKIESLVNYTFDTHITGPVRSDTNYVKDQETLVINAYKSYGLQAHYAGITANPSAEQAPELVDPSEFNSEWYNDRRRGKEKKPYTNGPSTRPLINTDKKGVYEHYVTLGILEEIFPLTRSCEIHTTDFTHHCGECWFCKERYWGFGRLV